MVDVAKVSMFGIPVGIFNWDDRYGVARFEYGHRVKLISVSEKLHAFGNSFRSLENAFSGRVFAKKFQDFFVMRSQALCSLWREQFFLLICHTSVVICYKQGTKLQKMLPLPNNGFAKYRPSI